MLCKRALFFGVFAVALSSIKADSFAQQLQQMSKDELSQSYGQVNLRYNEGSSCYRECDGNSKVCYFDFKMENFVTLAGACGDCAQGKIDDCFRANCMTLNGVERNVMSANRQIPGTGIRVCLGDYVVVDVTNEMAGANVAIHWHGIHQVETPWSDGVPMVTQCPIHDSNSFRYIFIATEVGTHYWHCHSGVHRMNGCLGWLVVRDTQANDPHSALYDYDLEEHEVLSTDWTNLLAEDYLPGKRSSFLGVDSLLINGYGTFHDVAEKTQTFAPIAAFYVERGKRYRWRYGNVGNQHYPMEFCIEHHQLTVIATDGAPVEPIVVDCIISHTGERYDFVLNTLTNRNISEVFIRLRAVPVPGADDLLREVARLIIVDDINTAKRSNADHLPFTDVDAYYEPYKNDITINHPDTICGASDSYCVPDLIPITSPQYENLRNIHETETVVQIPIDYGLLVGTTYPTHFLTYKSVTITINVNNISSSSPPVPGLTQDDSKVEYCNINKLPGNCNRTSTCFCPHMIELELNQVYEIIFTDRIIPGDVAYAHSFHLHGYYMQFLEVGQGLDYITGDPLYRNLTRNAVLKDTIMIPGNGYAITRFRATNPGYWLFHCHIEQHMHLGMRMIFKVGKRSDMVAAPENFPKCGSYPF